MTGEQPQGERALVVPAEDGGMYAIPESALETFRLTDEQRAQVEAKRPAGDDVQGFQDGIAAGPPLVGTYWTIAALGGFRSPPKYQQHWF